MTSFLEYLVVSHAEKLPQYDVAYLPGNSYNPIAELMRAIILRTVEDYHSKPEFREEAIAYLSDEDEDYIFSFRAICRTLGFDPDKTREMIINPIKKISTRRRAA